MAQQLSDPVVIVCTSGSAAYNYAPAIAEAFFQEVPLLVITADRPPEWIDQWDGQTIRQTNIYGQHVKGSFQFPDEYAHPDKVWYANRLANEAINLAMQFPQGPVHINIPLREPFYPETNEDFRFTEEIKSVEVVEPEKVLSDAVKNFLSVSLEKFERIMIVPGQQRPDQEIQKLLDNISTSGKALVVSDTISNMQSDQTIVFHDHFVSYLDSEQNPDLIISFGKSIISKSLKLFLRNSNAEHWHVQPNGYTPDTYQNLTKTILCEPYSFLQLLLDRDKTSNNTYLKHWKNLNQKIADLIPLLLQKAKFGEYKAISICLEAIPEQSKLHVANSMAVRYLNFLGARNQEIICNRGTSGIDGSNSTAVGCTFTTKEPVTLITGDMAFFYDRNAFWHNYQMNNLRIILLNNHAGGIFRLIDGPAKQPELEEYFETHQRLSAGYLAKDFGFEYHLATDQLSLEAGLKSFYEKSPNPKILEVQSESAKNAKILKGVKVGIKKILEEES